MHTRIFKLVSLLATSALIAIGLGISTPASAATVVSVSIHWNGSAVGASGGYLEVYEYDSGDKRWNKTSEVATNGAGVATASLTSFAVYRYCFRAAISLVRSQHLCYGADSVQNATSMMTVGPTQNLGVINLTSKAAINMSSVVVQGRPVVGQRLRVNVDGLPDGVTDTDIVWYRDASISLFSVLGDNLGTGPTYTVQPGDVGHTIRAYVYANGPRVSTGGANLLSVPYLTPAVGPVVKPMGFSGAPRITAPKWKVGKTATYAAPSVVPAGASATFQWLRNGSPINGQTSATHKLVRKDKRKKISLRVTYSFAGYETTTLFTGQSPKVKR